MVSAKAISIGILVVLLILTIVYIIVIFEAAKNQTLIFAPYTPPDPTVSHFRPLGEIRELTQEEIDRRNEIIAQTRPTDN